MNEIEIEMEIELPDNFIELNINEQLLVKEYLNSLNDIQKQTYLIAKEHLGTSFHLLKSNGYIQWLKLKEK